MLSSRAGDQEAPIPHVGVADRATLTRDSRSYLHGVLVHTATGDQMRRA